MAGLPSLMQQPGQAAPPGQAPMLPGMAQQPQAAPTPGGVTGELSQLRPEQLLAMYNNPQDMRPKWAVASAYAKAIEQQRQMQMAQGQGAMAQNAQQQQQMPVVPQLMAQQPQQPPPVMAALGGLMHGYAGGGAVAFRDGGNPTVEQILQKAPSARTPEENEILRAAGVELTRRTLPEGGVSALNKMLEGPFFRRLFTGDTYKLSPEELAKRTDTGATTERMFRALGGSQFVEPTVAAAQETPATPSAARPDIPRFTSQELERYVKTAAPALTPSPSPAAGPRMPSAQPAARPSTVGDAEMAALQQSMLNQQSNIRTLSQPSDEERLARQTARQAEADRLAQEREAARAFREASTKQYEDVQQRVNRPFLENPEAIAAFGAMLSPERGQLASGMLKGIGAIEASKRAQLDTARKEMRDDQRVAMQMESVNRQLEVARQEKLYADMQGDRQGSLAAAEKIAALQQKQAELVYGHAVKKEELRNQTMQAQAAMASATKPGEFAQMLQAFRTNPEAFKEMFAARSGSEDKLALARQALMEKDPTYKLARMQYVSEKDPAKKADAFRKIQEIERLNNIIDVSGKGSVPAGVTVEKIGN